MSFIDTFSDAKDFLEAASSINPLVCEFDIDVAASWQTVRMEVLRRCPDVTLSSNGEYFLVPKSYATGTKTSEGWLVAKTIFLFHADDPSVPEDDKRVQVYINVPSEHIADSKPEMQVYVDMRTIIKNLCSSAGWKLSTGVDGEALLDRMVEDALQLFDDAKDGAIPLRLAEYAYQDFRYWATDVTLRKIYNVCVGYLTSGDLEITEFSGIPRKADMPDVWDGKPPLGTISYNDPSPLRYVVNKWVYSTVTQDFHGTSLWKNIPDADLVELWQTVWQFFEDKVGLVPNCCICSVGVSGSNHDVHVKVELYHYKDFGTFLIEPCIGWQPVGGNSYTFPLLTDKVAFIQTQKVQNPITEQYYRGYYLTYRYKPTGARDSNVGPSTTSGADTATRIPITGNNTEYIYTGTVSAAGIDQSPYLSIYSNLWSSLDEEDGALTKSKKPGVTVTTTWLEFDDIYPQENIREVDTIVGPQRTISVDPDPAPDPEPEDQVTTIEGDNIDPEWPVPPPTRGSYDPPSPPPPISDPPPPEPTPVSVASRSKFFTEYVVKDISLESPVDALDKLGSFLWDKTVTGILATMFANPMDAIISCFELPFRWSNPQGDVIAPICLGRLNPTVPDEDEPWSGHDDCTAPVVTSRVHTIDFSSVSIPEFWNNACDYDNCSINIYLPYVGYRELDPKDIVGGSIHLKYLVDMLTGDFVATLYVSRDNITNTPLYSYEGNMAVKVPITAADRTGWIRSAASAIGGVASFATGNVAGGVTNLIAGIQGGVSGATKCSMVGDIGGNHGMLSVKQPFIVVKRARIKYAANPETYLGHPTFTCRSISELDGFNKFKSINLDGVDGSASEKAKLESLLLSGVYIK